MSKALTKKELLKQLDDYKSLRANLAFLGTHFTFNVKDGSHILSELRGLDLDRALELKKEAEVKHRYCYIYDELNEEIVTENELVDFSEFDEEEVK